MVRPRHTRLAAQRARKLRRTMTVSEASLWIGIRGGATGARFRRQVPIGHWIVDFASFDPAIVIEVDDKSHEYRDERNRTAYLESQGFTVLRFTNEEVRDHPDAVVEHIAQHVSALRRLSSPGGGGAP